MNIEVKADVSKYNINDIVVLKTWEELKITEKIQFLLDIKMHLGKRVKIVSLCGSCVEVKGVDEIGLTKTFMIKKEWISKKARKISKQIDLKADTKYIRKDLYNVLGTDYKVSYKTPEEDTALQECDGYVDVTTHNIVILIPDDSSPISVQNIENYQDKVLRHELVHAFLHESGLSYNSDWAMNEEMVDWIALQIPKMVKTMYNVDL